MTNLKRLWLILFVVLVLWILASYGAAQQMPQVPPALANSKQFQRWWWAFQQRAYPLGDIPKDAKLRALQQIEQFKASLPPALQPSGNWVNIGPAPILGGQTNPPSPVSGRVAHIAVNPNDPNNWLIGAAQGGIWQTIDGGITWTPLTDAQASLAMGSIAFAPSNPNIFYAGTGEAVFSGDAYAGAGLLKSTDAGGTWQLLATDIFAKTSFSDIKVDPADPDIVLAATTRGLAGRSGGLPPDVPPRGIFKSIDGGLTWSPTLGGTMDKSLEATSLEVDPTNFNNQYAGIGDIFGSVANGVYRSTDAGETWTRINGPWETMVGGVGRVELAISPSNPKVLYVSIQDAIDGVGNDRAVLGLWRTDNAWEETPEIPTWTQITSAPDYCGPQCYYSHKIIVDPTNPDVLYAGGISLWKFDAGAGGAELWRQAINGTSNSNDAFFAVAVDGAGNVVAAGRTTNTGTGSDFTVVKFNGNTGTVLWRKEINGTALAVAVDGAGNVVAAGTTVKPDFGGYFTVIKFNGNTGAELWRREISGTAGSGDALAVAVDGAGNVVAAGSTQNTGTGDDFTVIKFNGNTGAELWRKVINGTANGSDEALAVAVDGAGNVVAAGETRNTGTFNDFTVIKFNGATGTELWRKVINGTANSFDDANAVAVDGAGNVVAAGRTTNTGTFNDFTVIKFRGTDGAELWRQVINGTANGNDYANAVAVDGAGNVVAAGSTQNTGTSFSDFTVIGFNGNTGAELWRKVIHGTAIGNDAALAVVVDGAGNVVAAGATTNTGTGIDFTVIKFNGNTGEERWRQLIHGTANGTNVADAVTVDRSGNVVAAGATTNTGTGRTDPTVVKFDGATWTNVGSSIHADQHAMAWAGNQLIVGNDGGVWSTIDGGNTWTNHNDNANHNTNLSITQFYDGSIHPTNPFFALGGSQDNGTEKWTGTNDWQWIFGGDGGPSAISAISPDTAWAVSFQQLGIRRTINAGAHFDVVDTGIDKTGVPFIARLEKCPTNDNVFIAGTNDLWKTTNFFLGVQPSWLRNGPAVGVGISALAFAPSDTTCSTYAFGAGNGLLQLTTDGGSTWTNIDASNAVPNRYVTDLAFNPTDANVLYVTLSGFDEGTPGQPGHVFKSTNALSVSPTWSNVSPPVNIPHNTIVLDPFDPNIVYVGTDIGAWKSTDGGSTWSQMGPETGMPNVAVFDLKISDTGRLVAFTHGRGAFVLE